MKVASVPGRELRKRDRRARQESSFSASQGVKKEGKGRLERRVSSVTGREAGGCEVCWMGRPVTGCSDLFAKLFPWSQEACRRVPPHTPLTTPPCRHKSSCPAILYTVSDKSIGEIIAFKICTSQRLSKVNLHKFSFFSSQLCLRQSS